MPGHERRSDSSGCSLRQGAGAACGARHRVAAGASAIPRQPLSNLLPVCQFRARHPGKTA